MNILSKKRDIYRLHARLNKAVHPDQNDYGCHSSVTTYKSVKLHTLIQEER